MLLTSPSKFSTPENRSLSAPLTLPASSPVSVHRLAGARTCRVSPSLAVVSSKNTGASSPLPRSTRTKSPSPEPVMRTASTSVALSCTITARVAVSRTWIIATPSTWEPCTVMSCSPSPRLMPRSALSSIRGSSASNANDLRVESAAARCRRPPPELPPESSSKRRISARSRREGDRERLAAAMFITTPLNLTCARDALARKIQATTRLRPVVERKVTASNRAVSR